MATTNLSAYDKASLPDVSNYKFGIVTAEWNPEITENLEKGAVDTLIDNNVAKENITVWKVPGSFELIYGCKKMLESTDVDAVIAIGNVIQGETKHFDFVCEGVTQGMKDLNLNYNVPTIFCVLTDNTKQQSLDRSGGKLGNKGVECAVAAIKMVALNNL